MLKSASQFYNDLLKSFPFTPTDTQNELLLQLSEFVFNKDKKGIFLLKGYAGTGKTTTISSKLSLIYNI